MEYEFQRNNSTGTLVANFSMGQEILGFWFVEELGESTEKYDAIGQAIIQLQSNDLKQWRMAGRELSIELDAEEVRVFANEIDGDEDVELDEALSIYDGESEAFCGLADFQLVLESWREFINDKY